MAVHADHRLEAAGHAGVAQERGAAREHVLVCGLDVGVGADHRRDLAVEVPSQRHLLGGGLGVDVHEHDLALPAQRLERLLGAAERAVHLFHEDAAQQVDHPHRGAVAGGEHPRALAGRPGRHVRGPHQAGFLGQVLHALAAVPQVVAAGQHVDAGAEQIRGGVAGEPEAAGRVLAVGDHQVHRVAADQVGQQRAHHVAPGRADHVGDEQDPDHSRETTSRSPRRGSRGSP